MAGTTRTTPKARALGAELRETRNAAGLGLRALAELIDTSHATVSRWEKGDRSPRPEDVAAYLQAVHAPASTREHLLDLAREPDGPRWLSVGMPEQRHQLAALLEIERDASEIINASSLLIPGLLQTSAYARAIIGAGGVPNDEVETRVAVRIGRRDAITRTTPAPAQLQAFVDESALYRMIGDATVMSEQLRFLLETGTWPNVDLRVIPMRANWHPGLEGPFLLVTFADRPPVVQLENRRSALFFHEQEDVAAYQEAAARVREVAVSPDRTMELIAGVITDMEKAQ